MIHRDQLVAILADAFPEFAINADHADLPYLVLGDLARFIFERHQLRDAQIVRTAVQLIERLHTEGDEYVKEAATIGLLEGIQSVWENAGHNPQEFADLLLPESRRWWNSLERFWSAEIPYVGADLTDIAEAYAPPNIDGAQ